MKFLKTASMVRPDCKGFKPVHLGNMQRLYVGVNGTGKSYAMRYHLMEYLEKETVVRENKRTGKKTVSAPLVLIYDPNNHYKIDPLVVNGIMSLDAWKAPDGYPFLRVETWKQFSEWLEYFERDLILVFDEGAEIPRSAFSEVSTITNRRRLQLYNTPIFAATQEYHNNPPRLTRTVTEVILFRVMNQSDLKRIWTEITAFQEMFEGDYKHFCKTISTQKKYRCHHAVVELYEG